MGTCKRSSDSGDLNTLWRVAISLRHWSTRKENSNHIWIKSSRKSPGLLKKGGLEVWIWKRNIIWWNNIQLEWSWWLTLLWHDLLMFPKVFLRQSSVKAHSKFRLHLDLLVKSKVYFSLSVLMHLGTWQWSVEFFWGKCLTVLDVPAFIHTANSTYQYSLINGVLIMLSPLLSLDLNPVKNVWDILIITVPSNKKQYEYIQN